MMVTCFKGFHLTLKYWIPGKYEYGWWYTSTYWLSCMEEANAAHPEYERRRYPPTRLKMVS